MAYIKNTWVDQEVERPKTYEMVNNSDGSVTLVDSFGLVSELGTPVNADNMNHIEEGIEDHDRRLDILEGEGARADVNLSNLTEQGEKHFLNKSQITNCILSVEELVKVEPHNNLLKLKAGSIVYVSTNGTFNEVTISADVVDGSGGLYTEKGNRDLYVCYVPSKNELVNIPVNETFSQATAPTTFLANLYGGWFDTTNNIMKYTSDGGATWGICSLPFALGNPSTPSAGGTAWVNRIKQVFNGFGVVGQKTFATRGVTSLLPNGRNADGTLNNKEVVSTSLGIYDETGKSSWLCFWDGSRILTYGVSNYFEQDYKPTFSGNHATWLNTKENIMYQTSDGGATWNKSSLRCYLGKLEKATNGVITEFEPNKPFRAVDYNDLPITSICKTKATTSSTATQTSPAVIVQNYVNGTSWYRVWSDGWIEQGGKVSAGGSNPSEVTVTFLKAFSNANYTMIASSYDNSSGSPIDATINSRSATSAKIRTSNVAGGWYACGY